MKKYIDLIGQKFGRLTVISQAETVKDSKGYDVRQWNCICDCGNKEIKVVKEHCLKYGNTKSCGCLQKEAASNVFKNQTKEERAERNRKFKSKHNEFDLSNNYGICHCKNGIDALFDKEDFDLIKNHYWYLNCMGYIIPRDNMQKNKDIFMHRLIMNCPDGLYVDHINHNVYDNRKSNLRIVTTAQNEMNKGNRKDNTSGCKGVNWDKRHNKWHVRLSYNKVRMDLGYFDDFDKAVSVRKEAEKKYYGEYAFREEIVGDDLQL